MSTIVGSVGTSMANATGMPSQSHLVYAANQGAWWLFYLSGTQGVSAVYTTGSFASWSTPGSGSPFTLSEAHASEGRNFGFNVSNIAVTDELHMISSYDADGSTKHSRFTLAALLFGNTNAEAVVGTSTGLLSFQSGVTTALDSSNYIYDSSNFYFHNHSVGNEFRVAKSTNADAGTSWTAGFSAPPAIPGAAGSPGTSSITLSTGSGNMLIIYDNSVSTGSFTNLNYSTWNGSSWASEANVFGSSLTGTATNNWDAVARTTSDIHVVALSNNSNAYKHYRYNGSSWSAGDTISALTLASGGSVFLATDGTSVWAFAIDSSNTVKVSQWVSGTGWNAWNQVATNGATAASLSGYKQVVSGNIGLIWTLTNGSNYDIDGVLFSTASQQANGTVFCSMP